MGFRRFVRLIVLATAFTLLPPSTVHSIENPIKDKKLLRELKDLTPGTLTVRFGSAHTGGASYIGSGLILTANHNFFILREINKLSDFRIFIENVDGKSASFGANEYEVLEPQRTTRSPMVFDGKEYLQPKPDFALIRIKKSAQKKLTGFKPNRLDFSGVKYKNVSGKKIAALIAAGPGLTVYGVPTWETNMNYGNVLILKESSSSTELGAIYKGGPNFSAVANGDSGGPLFQLSETDELVQVGVTSSAVRHENGGIHSIFTDLSSVEFAENIREFKLAESELKLFKLCPSLLRSKY